MFVKIEFPVWWVVISNWGDKIVNMQAEIAEAITDFIDGRKWARNMNESFCLLMSR
jgi:hypothetical protein